MQARRHTFSVAARAGSVKASSARMRHGRHSSAPANSSAARSTVTTGNVLSHSRSRLIQVGGLFHRHRESFSALPQHACWPERGHPSWFYATCKRVQLRTGTTTEPGKTKHTYKSTDFKQCGGTSGCKGSICRDGVKLLIQETFASSLSMQNMQADTGWWDVKSGCPLLQVWPGTSCVPGLTCYKVSSYYWTCDVKPPKKTGTRLWRLLRNAS